MYSWDCQPSENGELAVTLVPILTWCHADFFLEQARKVLGVLETEFIGYLVERQLAVENVLLREVDDLVLDVALCRHASLFLHEVAEIARREAGLVGEIGDAGQTLAFGLAAAEILVKALLEAGHDVAIHLVSGDELAVVVAHAVI